MSSCRILSLNITSTYDSLEDNHACGIGALIDMRVLYCIMSTSQVAADWLTQPLSVKRSHIVVSAVALLCWETRLIHHLTCDWVIHSLYHHLLVTSLSTASSIRSLIISSPPSWSRRWPLPSSCPHRTIPLLPPHRSSSTTRDQHHV